MDTKNEQGVGCGAWLGLLREKAREASTGDIHNPQWHLAGRVHDWRNYVPDYVRTAWPELSESEKLLVIIMADKGAMAEEWD